VASDDLVACFDAAEDFDVGGPCDAGGDGDEACAEAAVVVGDEVDTLDQLVLFSRGGVGRGGGGFAVVLEEFILGDGIALDQGLDGNGEGVGLVRGGDLGGAGEAGTEIDFGGVEGDDDLEVLGLFGAGGGLRGGDAGGAEEGLIADLGDLTGEGLVGEGVDGDLGGLAEGDVDDVGLVDFDLGGDDGHVGEGHQGGTLSVLDAEDDCLTLANGDVGDEAVEGSEAPGEAEGIVIALQHGGALRHLAAGGSSLCLGLEDGGLALGESGNIHIVERLFSVEVLFGNELVVVEGLGALVVELFLLEVSCGLFHVGLGGLFGGDERVDVGARRVDGGLLGGDGAGGLLAFDGCEHLPDFYMVALFDIEVGDATEGGGADVDVGFWLDLTCATHSGDEVSVDGLGRGDRWDIGAAVQYGARDHTGYKDQDDYDQQNLLTGHGRFLLRRGFLESRHTFALRLVAKVYAGIRLSVPCKVESGFRPRIWVRYS
jgi:hypothetical protein